MSKPQIHESRRSLAIGALAIAAACGDVSPSGPDGGAGSGPDGAAETRLDADTPARSDASPSGTSDASPSDPDGAPSPDSGPPDGGEPVACDDGWTGPECDECTVYVDAHGGDDAANGLSWSDAKATVETGMQLADARRVSDNVDSCAVWVAAGTYVPGTERTDSYQLLDGVHLYGGFAGGEDALSERAIATNETILSGDLAGDDPSTGDNAYHVLLGADGAVLDGFTVTAGVADAAESPDHDGGGMYIEDGSPTIRNTTFSGNVADSSGGAVASFSSSPVLTNVSFENNSGSHGGALSSREGSLVLTNVTFHGNAAQNHGGALYFRFHTGSTLTNLLFVDNQASYGGALSIRDGSPVILTNATFYDNLAFNSGGAGYIAGGISWVQELQIRNSILWENDANEGADDLAIAQGDVSISHSIVQSGQPTRVDDADWIESFSDDPLFADPASGIFQLLQSSRGVDTGNSELANLPETDLAGNPRIADGDGEDGAAIDRGVFERQP